MKFKSGREYDANWDIFGVAENGWWGEGFSLTEGYDTQITWPADPNDPDGYVTAGLTADDVREIADKMIDRWMRFRASLDVRT